MSTIDPGIAAPSDAAKGLRILLWVVQGLLAASFALAGVMKLTTPVAELAPKLAWVTDVPVGLVRFIGASELLGAVGLVLPAATRVKPALTPVAASGLLLVMVLAATFHVYRGEAAHALPVNVAFAAACAFVAWGRFRKAAIPSR